MRLLSIHHVIPTRNPYIQIPTEGNALLGKILPSTLLGLILGSSRDSGLIDEIVKTTKNKTESSRTESYPISGIFNTVREGVEQGIGETRDFMRSTRIYGVSLKQRGELALHENGVR